MKHLARIFLIAIFALMCFSSQDICANAQPIADKCDICIEIANDVKDLSAQTVNNESSIIQTINYGGSFIVSLGQNDDSNNFSTKNHNLALRNQFNEMVSYIHNKSYLRYKNSLNNSIFLNEISPNAP